MLGASRREMDGPLAGARSAELEQSQDSATDILTVNVSRTPARDIDAEGFQNGYAAPRRSTRLVQIFGLAAAADGDALC